MRAYWWWLNANVTETSITRDLEAMAAQGFAAIAQRLGDMVAAEGIRLNHPFCVFSV